MDSFKKSATDEERLRYQGLAQLQQPQLARKAPEIPIDQAISRPGEGAQAGIALPRVTVKAILSQVKSRIALSPE